MLLLEDLAVAINAVNAVYGDYHGCYTKVTPCADGGIVFSATSGNSIKWYPDGRVKESSPDDWRKKVR